MREKDTKQAISVGLSRSLLRELEKACRREGRSRSNYVEMVLRKHLGMFDACYSK